MILADYQVNGQFPSKVATSGTAAVYFPRTLGSNGPGTTPATPTATNATGQLNLPGSQFYAAVQGQRLRVVVAGSVFTGASSTVNVTVQINTANSPATGLTTPTYTTFMTTGAVTAFSGRASWFLEGHLVIAGNSAVAADLGTGMNANFGSAAPLVQGQLSGWYEGAINQAIIPAAPANIAAIPTVTLAGQSMFTPSGLVVNITFGTGNANNAATLNQFTILGD
jgi:hypothetical protein